MRLGFVKKHDVGLVIVTGSCCFPGMAPLDELARRVVERAVSETGVGAQVRVMPASTAYLGGVPQAMIAEFMTAFRQSGRMGLPAILIDGEAVSYGVPALEHMNSVLLKAAGRKTTEEDKDE